MCLLSAIWTALFIYQHCIVYVCTCVLTKFMTEEFINKCMCIMVHVVLSMTFSFSVLCKTWSHDYCEYYFNHLLFV